MNKYLILDKIAQDYIYCKDKETLSYELEDWMNKYLDKSMNIIVKSYNYGKVYVIER